MVEVTSQYANMSLQLDQLLQGYDRRLRPGFGSKFKSVILLRYACSLEFC